MYLNYKNGFLTGQQKEDAVYNCLTCFTIPKLVDTHDFSVLSTIYCVYLAFIVTIAVIGMDMLLILMAFQIIGNLMIFINRVETLYASNDIIIKETYKDTQPASSQGFNNKGNEIIQEIISESKENNVFHITNENTHYEYKSFRPFNVEENKIIYEKLVNCVKHHSMIILFAKNMSNVFGSILGINYGFQLASCCLLLLECQGGFDAMIRFGPVTFIIFGQLILLSIIFEIIATTSEKLTTSVYGTPWERMDTRNRRTVQIMLVRAQRPISVTALGLTNVGVTTMAQVNYIIIHIHIQFIQEIDGGSQSESLLFRSPVALSPSPRVTIGWSMTSGRGGHVFAAVNISEEPSTTWACPYGITTGDRDSRLPLWQRPSNGSDGDLRPTRTYLLRVLTRHVSQ
ncbi:7tm odorant receptor domain-containing protein [Phthorimaea operculella]|nr:7tm odorant receptor domain-containing protein [Phthorimaea operculella]